MQIKSVIIPIFIVIIFLTTGFLTVLAQGPDAISLIDSVDQINAANTGKPLTERMAVVMLPEDDNEDMNYNRIEDQFEPDLAGLSDTDFVEAIIRTEFRIDDEFETYLKSAGAEIVYVAHGVESAGVRITKGDLMMLSRNPLIVRIYKNHEVVSTLDTSVPVINAGSSKLTAAGYGDLDGSGVTITVIDSGVDGSHRTFPDGKIIAFKDYNGGRDDLDPTNGMSTYDSTQQPHGTMCASVAAGTGGGRTLPAAGKYQLYGCRA